MDKLLHIGAKTLSTVCYPLLVPTYLMVAFCAAFSHLLMPLPGVYWLMAVGGTAFFTLLNPLCILWALKGLGRITDMDVSRREDRTIVFAFTLVSVCAWCYYLHHILHVPVFLFWTAVATTVTLVVVALINLRWKISVHLSTMGGALGFTVGMLLYFGVLAPYLICGLLLLSLLLMYARIYLGAHTPAQTVCGFVLGLVATLVPNIILAYV